MKKLSSTNNINRTYLENQCPMVHALSKIGTRWKPLILSRLSKKDMRFTELKADLPNITERMLTLSLRELEKDELIRRCDNGRFPKVVSYSLTSSGRQLRPVLDGICEWGKMDMQKAAAAMNGSALLH